MDEYKVGSNGDIIQNSVLIEHLQLDSKFSFEVLGMGRQIYEDKKQNKKNNIFFPANDRKTSRFHCKLKVDNCSIYFLCFNILQLKF